MKSTDIRIAAISKTGAKTKVFSNTSAITWNSKRRFK